MASMRLLYPYRAGGKLAGAPDAAPDDEASAASAPSEGDSTQFNSPGAASTATGEVEHPTRVACVCSHMPSWPVVPVSCSDLCLDARYAGGAFR